MKVGIFNRWLTTLGGGELHSLAIGCALSQLGADVTFFAPEIPGYATIFDRLGLDTSACKFTSLGSNQANLTSVSEQFDLFIHCSVTQELPILISRKRVAMVFFPRKPLEAEDCRSCFDGVWCNSAFTCDWIRRYWGVPARILYPAIFTRKNDAPEKENSIITVGRFFAGDHSKQHQVLIKAFIELRQRNSEEWKFRIVGGLSNRLQDVYYFNELVRNITCDGIELLPNLSRSTLEQLYAKSTFYWHATGYAVDPTIEPWRCEHFGITPVESMAFGCIPFVVGNGGPLEIIEHRVNGIHWNNFDDLITNTVQIGTDPLLRRDLSTLALARSRHFSFGRLRERLVTLLAEMQVT